MPPNHSPEARPVLFPGEQIGVDIARLERPILDAKLVNGAPLTFREVLVELFDRLPEQTTQPVVISVLTGIFQRRVTAATNRTPDEAHHAATRLAATFWAIGLHSGFFRENRLGRSE